MASIFLQLARRANDLSLLFGMSASPARHARLVRRAQLWVAHNEPHLDRAIAFLGPQDARHPDVASALIAVHRLRALAGASTRTRGETSGAPPLDPAVATLLHLARRYVDGQAVQLDTIARQVRSIRTRAGQLSIRDLDFAVGAVTNIDSYRRRRGLRDVTFGPPLRAAVRARLRVP